MPAISFISASGEVATIDADLGQSVMEAAVNNQVTGIDADCGGSCACATCHVIVEESWFDRLVPPAELEAEMLEFVAEPSPRSRLSCQLVVTKDLDGLVVRLPISQR